MATTAAKVNGAKAAKAEEGEVHIANDVTELIGERGHGVGVRRWGAALARGQAVRAGCGQRLPPCPAPPNPCPPAQATRRWCTSSA
jgi:hypothetical protein